MNQQYASTALQLDPNGEKSAQTLAAERARLAADQRGSFLKEVFAFGVDADGAVSLDEAKAANKLNGRGRASRLTPIAVFEEMDSNQDGTADFAEIFERSKQIKSRMVRRTRKEEVIESILLLDADGDGVTMLSELVNGIDRLASEDN